MEKRLVLVVLGYKYEVSGTYSDYLNRVANFIVANSKRIDLVVLSGGLSRKKSLPGLSEALIIYRHLWMKISRINIPVILEEKSLTTRENIEFSADVLSGRVLDCEDGHIHPEDHELIIFCDMEKKDLVDLLMPIYLKGFDYRVAAMPITSQSIYQSWSQLMLMVYEAWSVQIPLLARLRRAYKERKSLSA